MRFFAFSILSLHESECSHLVNMLLYGQLLVHYYLGHSTGVNGLGDPGRLLGFVLLMRLVNEETTK